MTESSDGDIDGPALLHLPGASSQTQVASLLMCAIQHLLHAKGQISEPVSMLQSRRARENLAKERQRGMLDSNIAKPRSKGASLTERKRMRKIDELLLALHRLELALANAIHEMYQIYRRYELDHTHVAVMIKFGTSRRSCRQEVRIDLRDILALPPTEPALQDVNAKRQKMNLLERKLVRFLLGLSAENEAFNRVLTSPLTLTRLHVFLLAPASFTCRGWTRHRAWTRVPFRSAAVDLPVDGDTGPSETHQTLVHEMVEVGASASNENQMNIDSLQAADDDFDIRRMRKMQERALQRQQQRVSAMLQERGTTTKRRKRQPTSASFVINTSKDDVEDSPSKEELDRLGEKMKGAHWFACKVTPKGVL